MSSFLKVKLNYAGWGLKTQFEVNFIVKKKIE